MMRAVRRMNDGLDRLFDRYPRLFRWINALHLAYYMNQLGTFSFLFHVLVAALGFILDAILDACGYSMRVSVPSDQV